MAQTPKSVSVNVQGLTNTTIYTVPVGKTAIAKAVIGANADNSGSTLTVSKFASGQNFPISTNQSPVAVNATGGTTIRGVNLLTAPITMGAGEQLKVYSPINSFYNLPNVSTFVNDSSGGAPTVYQVQYGNGKYIAVGYSYSGGAFIATSTDAVTWTQNTAVVPLTNALHSIVNVGSIWVAINNSATSTALYSSDNGVTWAPSAFSTSTVIKTIAASSSTFLVAGSNGRVYSSTDGNTWTESTAYFTRVGVATAIYSVSWSGTHWLVQNLYGALVSSDLVTWNSYVGSNFGRNISGEIQSIAWSGAYSRYYSSRNVSNSLNINSSPNGLSWTNLASATYAIQKVACAGNNPVILGLPAVGSSSRMVSTDGVTFSSSSDVVGITGPVFGLANGYFLSTGINNNDMYLSTDPTTTAGTNRGSLRAGYVTCAAADPVSGKWISVQVADGSGQIFLDGGTSGTNIGGTSFNSGYNSGSYGTPQSACWSAVDGYFYIISQLGYIFRCTSYNGGILLISQVPSGGASSSTYQCTITAVGTTLYAITSNTGLPNSLYVGSTLTGGASWVEQNFYAGAYQNCFYNCTVANRSGNYWGECAATNGTDFVWTNLKGSCFALTPSNGATTMRMPASPNAGGVQTAGAYQFVYGAYDAVGNYAQGYLYTTNAITTYGNFVPTTTVTDYFNTAYLPVNKIAYVGGNYYAVGVAQNQLYSSSTPVFTTGRGGGTSIAGVTPVMPAAGFANDGTNLVGCPNGSALFVCKTTTPSSYLYAATVTASVVEID